MDVSQTVQLLNCCEDGSEGKTNKIDMLNIKSLMFVGEFVGYRFKGPRIKLHRHQMVFFFINHWYSK